MKVNVKLNSGAAFNRYVHNFEDRKKKVTAWF